MKTNVTEVYLSLRGDDFDPEHLSSVIGVSPTFSAKKGDTLLKKSTYQSSLWIYSSGKINGDIVDVYEISSELINKLDNCKGELIKAISTFDLEAVFQVVIKLSMDESIPVPPVGFDVGTIEFINSIGARIDIDIDKIYC